MVAIQGAGHGDTAASPEVCCVRLMSICHLKFTIIIITPNYKGYTKIYAQGIQQSGGISATDTDNHNNTIIKMHQAHPPSYRLLYILALVRHLSVSHSQMLHGCCFAHGRLATR